MAKYDKHIEKCIEADKKKFAETMECLRVNSPDVYARIKEVEAEAREIEKKEGLAAALRYIIYSKFEKND